MNATQDLPPLPPATAAAAQGVNGWNAQWIEEMHGRWLEDPTSVPDSWQHFFDGWSLGSETSDVNDRPTPGQVAVICLIDRIRRFGHTAARIDPLRRRELDESITSIDNLGLAESDLARTFDAQDLPIQSPATLKTIHDTLTRSWCGTLGVESEHLRSADHRHWWRQQIESEDATKPLPNERRQRILHALQRATGLERFLMRRYVGSKWFSLEGSETLIPMLTELLESAGEYGVEEIAFGMAHRGRINVLVNILEKSYDQLFTEFEEAWTEDFIESGGDVKYHRGYSASVETDEGHPIHLTMASNPSHLEWGHPVVLGRVRAKQRLRGDAARRRCVPILIHGDAALPGQGVVQELANMSGLPAYDVGGSIHIVINNQIGFTAEHHEAFATMYCTDVLRGLDIPVLHVNGMDPDQCVRAMDLAITWRQRFGIDVVIDLWGWRKYGHNETDEPTFTNPTIYEVIRDMPPIVESYAAELADAGVISATESVQEEQRLLEVMHDAQQRIREKPVRPTPTAFDDGSTWSGFSKSWNNDEVDTTVSRNTLEQITDTFAKLPEGFVPHRKLSKLLEDRSQAVRDDRPLDWAMGELLAYGSLLLDGYPIRITGEDCLRGTFSHRHAVFYDNKTGMPWSPLDHIDVAQSRMCIHNSPVTESACIGFEYGYSLGDPNMLVVWEAQFGDFANVGQVYFDQFIASAERKWGRFSGLICLLPHGYEGAGPEHSSARLERFLQLCADGNMEVAIPTSPSQMFHLLRRQMRRSFRKPLIVLTPKSLLRHRSALSSVSDLTDGRFDPVLDDPSSDPAAVSRVLLCSGKIGWELIDARQNCEMPERTAVVRIEQLYPFPEEHIQQIRSRYELAEDWVWVQEEPRNAGAWTWMADMFIQSFNTHLSVVSRPANASPAVGSSRLHREEQEEVIAAALQCNNAEQNDRRQRT